MIQIKKNWDILLGVITMHRWSKGAIVASTKGQRDAGFTPCKVSQKGQISVVNIIGWGLAISLATIGSYATQSRVTDTKIDIIKTENTKTIEKTAKLEEAVETIKKDTATIKEDVKGINSKLDQLIGQLKRQ